MLITKICSVTLTRQPRTTASKIRPDLKDFNIAKEGCISQMGVFIYENIYKKRSIEAEADYTFPNIIQSMGRLCQAMSIITVPLARPSLV